MSGTGIFARTFEELDAVVQIGIANGRVISLSVPDTPEPNASSDNEKLDWIDGYLAGTEQDVTDIEIGLTVPGEQRTVLENVRKIPYGEELRLKRVVARSQGLDPDAEAVLKTARTALAENPIPLFIPDHRVVDGPSGLPADVEATLRKIEGL
ncbi:MGMT family protein [Halodesulfurarchaeum sp.]|uniref:MGMT family protein n=1 Tax=Halodesulfurarchaeum sp. TaxID=1980530 RepID=UPI001BC42E86|nr:methylated-DNA--[protein]-cysteine S-methyltransferase [Halodesulfurarchaeum sp.]